MQFVSDGPDIPDTLLQAHEEGNVVFFCGAGISYPAGLPGFGSLVEKIYQKIGTTFEPIECTAYEQKKYDTTLELLERRVAGQKHSMRTALANILKPNLRRKGALDTHIALLQLARNRQGLIRLVTTNFDHLFEKAAKRNKQPVTSYAAPMLPIPKNSRWDGVVYLHGILPKKTTDTTLLNRLVVTSGDFGLAYLTERWAARFTSELFRNYVVCFVGYSIDDPVLRYMMDALAADRILGESTPRAYAFGSYELGKEEITTENWLAKGVTPVLYQSSGHDHSLLHQTLKTWGDTYRDGILGKERIVAQYAMAHPSASTQQDDFVGRMLWALSDNSGAPAKRFANMDPVPPLSWLWEFEKRRYCHDDLARFNVPSNPKSDSKLTFSLINRPIHYEYAPQMALVFSETNFCPLDNVMDHLARWLARHIGDPELILWLSQQGGLMHSRLQWHVEQALSEIEQMERESNTAALDRISQEAPNAIPIPMLRPIWRLLLAGRIKAFTQSSHRLYWEEQFKQKGLTTSHRLILRELLTPAIRLKKLFSFQDESVKSAPPTHLSQIIDWELILNGSQYIYSDLKDNEQWKKALPSLHNEFQQLILDVLDLQYELSSSKEFADNSSWDLPSISPHWQNRGFRDWIVLIEFLRDSWNSIYLHDKKKAKELALSWWSLPYPVFKRLALFAASHDACVRAEQWVTWLINDPQWIWSPDTQRELCRLFVLQGHTIELKNQNKLETVILAGFSQEMFTTNQPQDQWAALVNREVWLRLSKLSASGLHLGTFANERLLRLSRMYPQWKLADNESDEFPRWMSGTGDPDFEEQYITDIAPTKRAELINWLKGKNLSQKKSLFERDTWQNTCKQHLLNTGYALRDLAEENIWPSQYWRTALQVWSDKRLIQRSWKHFASIVLAMPDDIFTQVIHSLARWLEEISNSLACQQDIFLELCQRIINRPFPDEDDVEKSITQAINHPIGHTTQALLSLCFKENLRDNDGLPDVIKNVFTTLCNLQSIPFRYARIILAANIIYLFRVDKSWTERYLLPIFNWDNNELEARTVWPGFLWSPRIYPPLLTAFKTSFLNTAAHYNELGEYEVTKQYAVFLTYAALEPTDDYTSEDYRQAFSQLPPDGLSVSARTLVNALESAGEQREEYWLNRIKPFWRNIWPKSQHLRTTHIAESLVQLGIAGQKQFPDIFEVVKDWLIPFEHPDYTVKLLHDSGLTARFPKETLTLLDAITDQQRYPRKLEACLIAISEADPTQFTDSRYERLINYVRST